MEEKSYFLAPEEYLPLVKKIVDRIDIKLPDHWDKKDMIGYGVLGLMEALERFKPEKGVKFVTFASMRIRGAILDALRKEAPISRDRWALIRKITEVSDQLSQDWGEGPDSKEIAQKIGIDEKEVENALQWINYLSNYSLEQTLGFTEDNEITIMDTIASSATEEPEETYLRKERVERLSDAITRLDERQRLVLTLYYYEELTMKEIAALMGVTVSRVSQLKTKALIELRKKIKGDI